MRGGFVRSALPDIVHYLYFTYNTQAGDLDRAKPVFSSIQMIEM